MPGGTPSERVHAIARHYAAIPIPTYVYAREDDEFVLVAFNEAADSLTGGAVRDFIGKTPREIGPFPPDLLENLCACFAERVPLTCEVEYPAAGRTRYLVGRYSYAPPNLVIVHVEDVTESRFAALAQQRLAAIIESTDDAIIAKDLNGTITAWNRAAERMFGFTADEAIGRSVRMIIPPERQTEEDDVLARIRAGRSVEHFETVRMRSDGTRFDASVTISPIRDTSGRIVGASKIARDITERRRVERLREELLERERQQREEAVVARDRLGFLAEVSALLVSTLDYEETLDRAVHLALPRLGDFCNVLVRNEQGGLRDVASGHVVPEKEPLVRDIARRFGTLSDDYAGGSVQAFRAGLTVVLHRSRLGERMDRIPGPDRELPARLAELAVCSVIGVPLLVRGRAIGVMTLGTTLGESRHEYDQADVWLVEEFARRVSLAVENARLFRQAEELNRLKDEFLATLSHELRTPLSAILGWARMLRANTLAEGARQRALESIERNAVAQARIVDDILDVAGGAAGTLRLEMRRADLSDVAQRAVVAVTPAATAKGIRIELSAPEPVPLVADAARLQQVAWNLLSNAVKFTPPGGLVTVAVSMRERQAELVVRDTGVGISRSFLPHVFDKFRQADASFSRQHGGLGLGLAIAQHIVELHGGSIQAASDGEARGAQFTVRLPVAPAS
ncbi:MAG: PAS domain S-box protein [Betaproteobacteria bacterium]